MGAAFAVDTDEKDAVGVAEEDNADSGHSGEEDSGQQGGTITELMVSTLLLVKEQWGGGLGLIRLQCEPGDITAQVLEAMEDGFATEAGLKREMQWLAATLGALARALREEANFAEHWTSVG